MKNMVVLKMLKNVLSYFKLLLGDHFFSSKKNIAVFVAVLFFCVFEIFAIGGDWSIFKRYKDMQRKIDKELSVLENEGKIIDEQLDEIDKNKKLINEEVNKISKEKESNKNELARLNREVRSIENDVNDLQKRWEYYYDLYLNTSWWSYSDLINARKPIEKELNRNRELIDKKYKRLNELNKRNITIKKELETCATKLEEIRVSHEEVEKRHNANKILLSELEKDRDLKMKYKRALRDRVISVENWFYIIVVFYCFLLLIFLVFGCLCLKKLHGFREEMEQLVAN